MNFFDDTTKAWQVLALTIPVQKAKTWVYIMQNWAALRFTVKGYIQELDNNLLEDILNGYSLIILLCINLDDGRNSSCNRSTQDLTLVL